MSSSRADQGTHVYALDTARPDIEVLGDSEARGARSGATYAIPFALRSGIVLVDVAEVTTRITDQRGAFTLQAPPTAPLPVPPADVFAIPAILRDAFQRRLFDVDIDDSHIYPGLDGLCRMLDWHARTRVTRTDQMSPISEPPDRSADGKMPSSRVLFAETAGIGRKLAASVLAAAERKVTASDGNVSLKRLRFVPSSRVDVEGGFQVLANTAVRKGARSVVLGTVVAIQGDEQDQTLKDLTIRDL